MSDKPIVQQALAAELADRDRRRALGGHLEDLRENVRFSHYPLTFFIFSVPCEYMRAAELLSSTSFASSSSHFLVAVSADAWGTL